ncbi:Zinc phosphodiesterase ELAC protein 2 [Entomophthora muscae]|uniref:Zinc phosphodiesterase ELAC protein 2 n=1 Tax=Entomophthora muscae TaxID=34485 RepID=A0ACC2SCS9_9FUNG|nr:Zinc phosphodiesterase ELAC protein 2 [Entomophthora muscae]
MLSIANLGRRLRPHLPISSQLVRPLRPVPHHRNFKPLGQLSSVPTFCRTSRLFSSTSGSFMKLVLQIVGTSGAKDASPSVILFSDKARYLFNCGESTQRLITEHRAKTNRFDAIFSSQDPQ